MYNYLNIICASCGLLHSTNTWPPFTQHLPAWWGFITAEESLIIWQTHLRKSLPFRNFLKHMLRFSNKNFFSEGFPFFRWPHPARESAALLGCQRTTPHEREGNRNSPERVLEKKILYCVCTPSRRMYPSTGKNKWQMDGIKSTFCGASSL